MNRSERARIAEETVAILERGFYKRPAGRRMDLCEEIEQCRTGSVHYAEDAFITMFGSTA
jgi:hypothetical protein